MGLAHHCWVDFNKQPQPNGYVRWWFKDNNYKGYAHRVVYEFFNETIPQGLQIDHLCRNRACYNPYHLEIVTQQENIKRGGSITNTHKEKTHCPYGHEYTESNTWVNSKGWRWCRECHNKKERERKSRLKLRSK